MALSRQPRTFQTWNFDGWSGTPHDLVGLAETIQAQVPDGEFAVIVEEGGQTRTGDSPQALSQLRAGERPDRITVNVKRYEPAEGGIGRGKSTRVRLELGHVGSWRRVWVFAKSEASARAILEGTKEAILPRVPWYSSRWGRRLSSALVGFLPATLLLSFGLLGFAVWDAPPWLPIATAVLWWPLALLGPVLSELWLFPPFEIHDGRSRPRRWAWGIVAFVLLPALVTAVASAVVE